MNRRSWLLAGFLAAVEGMLLMLLGVLLTAAIVAVGFGLGVTLAWLGS